MPYTSFRKDAPSYTERNINYYPGGQQGPYSTVVQGIDVATFSESRSGGKRSARGTEVDRPFTWVTKYVTSYTGRKLKSRVFSKRLRKWVYARESVVVPRLVKVYSRKKKGLDLPPNALHFEQTTRYEPPKIETIKSTYEPQPGFCRTTEGDLVAGSIMLTAPWPRPASVMSGIQYIDDDGRFYTAVEQADKQASSKLREKVKNQSVNFAQFLMERQQTIALFADSAKRLAKVLLAIKRGDFVGAGLHLFPTDSKKLANDVLMLQFGIKPLLSDLDGMAKYLAQQPTLYADIISRSRVDVKWQSRSVLTRHGWHRFKSELDDEGFVEVVYKYRVKMAMPVLQGMKELGFGNPLALGWELIPFSFVVDWFLPIGAFLNSLDSCEGVQIIHGHKTVFQQRRLTITRNYGGQTAEGYTTESKSCAADFKQVKCDREIVTKFPECHWPDLKNPLSMAHIIDAMALIRQLS